ncbi:MAG TPA: RHS repeat-associated core domain-containing protein [Thiotrichaceae bacterium]|nr:RHS repeat-associated core domain-containing protein [Thiotrichaceae bacterium]
MDSQGNVVWAAVYEAFGKARVDVALVENNLRFAGQYFDAETGLHYNWHRYYDPTTGRYLRVDPIPSVNRYAYVLGNPVNFIDPTGEFGVVGALIGAALDLLAQLALNGWNLNCVSWTQVGIAGALGAVGGAAFGGAFKHAVSGKKWSQLSKEWKNVSPRYRKAQKKAGNAPKGNWDAHHWAFPREGRKGPTWRNHPANLNPIPRNIHWRIHGNDPNFEKFGPLRRWWYETPNWAKAAEGALGGGIAGDVATAGDCECKN